MTADAGVRAASERFYGALERMANGDAKSMSKVWSHRADVTTQHPIGGREEGWDEVRESFANVAGIAEDGDVTVTDRLVRVVGDLAYELVTEHVSMSVAGTPLEAEVRATNVYRLEDGEWKIVHHHADTSNEFIEILEGLEAGE